jgi:hypothetical protein
MIFFLVIIASNLFYYRPNNQDNDNKSIHCRKLPSYLVFNFMFSWDGSKRIAQVGARKDLHKLAHATSKKKCRTETVGRPSQMVPLRLRACHRLLRLRSSLPLPITITITMAAPQPQPGCKTISSRKLLPSRPPPPPPYPHAALPHCLLLCPQRLPPARRPRGSGQWPPTRRLLRPRL